MSITPQDIQDQEFHVRFRGFDMAEVDGFLEEVAAELQQLLLEKRHLSERLQELEKNNEEYIRQEQTFKNAIIAAQKVADEMEAKSRREAEDLVAAARLEADEIVKKAEAERGVLAEEVANLKQLAARTGDALRQTLREYMQKLDDDFPPAAVTGRIIRKTPAEATPPPIEDDSDSLFQKIDFEDLEDSGPRLAFNDSLPPERGPAVNLDDEDCDQENT